MRLLQVPNQDHKLVLLTSKPPKTMASGPRNHIWCLILNPGIELKHIEEEETAVKGQVWIKDLR